MKKCIQIDKYITKRNIFLLVVLLLMYVVSFNIPITADDLSYSFSRLDGTRLMNIFDVFSSVGHEYMTWNGRVLCYFIAQVIFIDSKQLIFRIIWPIVNLLIIMQIYKLVDNKKENNYILYFISFAFLFGHKLVMNQTMFWIIGWVTYVLPLLPMFFVFNELKNIEKDNTVSKNVLLFLSGISSCLFVEHYTLIMMGVVLCYMFFKIIKRNKIFNLKSTIIIISVVLGSAIIFCAPGIFVRAATDDFANSSLIDRLYFGYSRFVYTHFYLNSKIFLIIYVILIMYFLKKEKNTYIKYISILLLIPLLIVTPLIMHKSNLLGYETIDILTNQWSYYSYNLDNYIKHSLIVFYNIFLLLFLIGRIACNVKKVDILILYIAALCSNLCFVLSDKACERTQYISYILMLVIVSILLFYFNFRYKREMSFVFIALTVLLLFRYSDAYIKENEIFNKNDKVLKECALNNCEEIEIYEHNYDYVFKSELDFENQKNWVLRDIRRFYNLNPDVIIKSIK